MTTETTPEYKKVALRVAEVSVTCPDCGSEQPLPFMEDDDGCTLRVPDDERYIRCDNCECLIEVVPIKLEAVNE